jgi:drug/metabolite transporter (DMT)-like permease
MQTDMQDEKRGGWMIWASLIFLMLVWGSTFILVKRGLETFGPSQVASLRMTAAMIPLLYWGIRHAFLVPRDRLKYLFASAMLGVFVPSFLFANAQMYINSSMAGVLNALTPAMTFVIGLVFFGQPSSWMKILGLLIGFLGSATLIMINAEGKFAVNNYAFLIVIATMGYGANVNVVKHYLRDVHPIHLTTITLSICGLLGLGYFLTTDWPADALTTAQGRQSLLSLIALGLLGTALAQTVFNRMLSVTSALFASSITYFIPIVAVMWGVWDGEVMSVFHYLGMLLVIIGIVILSRFG